MLQSMFTPLALFSLAMSILTIFISTAENLHGKYHEIKDFPETFNTYRHEILRCIQNYELWLRLWHLPDEASYIGLFGEGGWKAIQNRKQNVEDLIIKILGILHLEEPVAAQQSIELRSCDPQKWRDFTQNLGVILKTYKPEKHILRRIVGIFGPNKYLKDKFTELEKAIINLSRESSDTYQARGHGQEPKRREEIEATNNTVKFRAIARCLMTEIHHQIEYNRGVRAWFLELELPNGGAENGSVAIDQIIRNCDISIVARNASLRGGGSEMREIQMRRLRGFPETEDRRVSKLLSAMRSLHTQSKSIVSIEGQIYQLNMSDVPPQQIKPWEDLIVKCSGDEEIRKALELERARFVLGLTLWFILLWETGWFNHVCSCAFGWVNFSRELDDPRLKHIYETFKVDGNLDPPTSCPKKLDLKHPFYYFGILLAELALARPIQSVSNFDLRQPAWQFQCPEHENIPPQLKKAITFCFDRATDEKWLDKTEALATDRVGDFLKGVLEPVKQYHDVVKENFKYSSRLAELVQSFQGNVP